MKVEKIQIEKLLCDPNNARKHDTKNLMAIKGSLTKFGQQKPIVVNHKNIVIAGNGTLIAAKDLGWKEINVVRSDLEGFEATAFAIADNRTSELAEWDDEILNQTLASLEMNEFDVTGIGFDDKDWDSISEGANIEDEVYTKKIESPIYEIKGDKPKINDLYYIEKANELISEINKSCLPEDQKNFLIHAAYRHIVFNYENIAEFYAHSSKQVQELMERSALVIIDFNKAIENGFVQLTKEFAESVETEK